MIKKLRNKIKGGIDLTLVLIIVIIGFGAALGMGKIKPPKIVPGVEYILETPAPAQKEASLQLNRLTFNKIVMPTPSEVNACAEDGSINEEPEIFYASDPARGGTAVAGGQIRVWVWEDDGNGGSVAPGTVIDPATGVIMTPGDRTAADSGGYLWEPSIYITPLTAPDQQPPYSGDKENGGTPHFPVIIKGVVTIEDSNDTIESVPIDPPVNIITDKTGSGWTFAQFIWDVDSMGLTSGYYRAQMIFHDGDGDRALNCTTIQI